MLFCVKLHPLYPAEQRQPHEQGKNVCFFIGYINGYTTRGYRDFQVFILETPYFLTNQTFMRLGFFRLSLSKEDIQIQPARRRPCQVSKRKMYGV